MEYGYDAINANNSLKSINYDRQSPYMFECFKIKV